MDNSKLTSGRHSPGKESLAGSLGTPAAQECQRAAEDVAGGGQEGPHSDGQALLVQVPQRRNTGAGVPSKLSHGPGCLPSTFQNLSETYISTGSYTIHKKLPH